jgi:hypothetical protein
MLDSAPLFRYVNIDAHHFYTSNWTELQEAGAPWKLEGEACQLGATNKMTTYTCTQTTNCESGAEATVLVGADDFVTLFKNSEAKLYSDNWKLGKKVQFKVRPNDVISVQLFNHGLGFQYGVSIAPNNPGVFFGQIKFAGMTISSNPSSWKCIVGKKSSDGFDSWPIAVSYGDTTDPKTIWDTRTPIKGDNIKYIWTSENYIPGQYITCATRIPGFCLESNKKWDGAACVCANTCSSDRAQNSNCECVCPDKTSVQTNVDGAKRCSTTCSGKNVWNAEWTKCQCPNTCPKGQQLDANCNCICPPGTTLQTNIDGKQMCLTECDNPNKKWNSWWSACTCTNECPALQEHDTNCNCACKAGTSRQVNVNGDVMCTSVCPTNKQWDADFSQCICSNVCPSGQVRTSSDCTCRCSPGLTLYKNIKGDSKCMPGCAINQQYDENWVCACKDGISVKKNVNGIEQCVSSCPKGTAHDATWSQCTEQCPENQEKSKDSTSCVCSAAKTIQRNTEGATKCTEVCPAKKIWAEDWSQCICTNECPYNQVHNDDDCSCQCPRGTELLTNIDGALKCVALCTLENQIYDSNWGSCRCKAGMELAQNNAAELKCILPEKGCKNPNKVFTSDWSQCECTNTCAKGLDYVRNEDDCTCDCPSGTTLQQNIHGEKKCKQTCPKNQYYNANFDTCQCFAGFIQQQNIDGTYQCVPEQCGSAQVYNSDFTQCVCPKECGINEEQNPDNCNCACKADTLYQVSTAGVTRCMPACEATNPFKRYDKDFSSCKCINKCSAPEVRNDDTCECIFSPIDRHLQEDQRPKVEKLVEALVDKERLKEIRLWKAVVFAKEYMERLAELLKKLEARYRVIKEEKVIVLQIIEAAIGFKDTYTQQNANDIMSLLSELLLGEIAELEDHIKLTKANLEQAKGDYVEAITEYERERPERMIRLKISDEVKLRGRIIDGEKGYLHDVTFESFVDENAECVKCDISSFECGLNSEPVYVDDPQTECKICVCQPNHVLDVYTANITIPVFSHGTLLETKTAQERASRYAN